MRLFGSFILSILIYIGLFGLFLLVLKQNKPQKPKIVYVHQVITPQIKKQSKEKNIPKPKKNLAKKIELQKKEVNKETKTKDNFSKGGDYKIDDLFSNVKDNIPTTPIKHKHKQNMTKKKGNSIAKEIKKTLAKLKTNITVSNAQGSDNDKQYIQNELSKVWSEINTNIGDFVKIKININNAKINVIVIATNLDTIRLNQFLSKINSIDTSKIGNLDAIIEFKSELKE